MNKEQNKEKGKILSKLLLIKSDLQGINKESLNSEIAEPLSDLENKVEIFIKSLIQK